MTRFLPRTTNTQFVTIGGGGAAVVDAPGDISLTLPLCRYQPREGTRYAPKLSFRIVFNLWESVLSIFVEDITNRRILQIPSILHCWLIVKNPEAGYVAVFQWRQCC